MTKKKAQTQPTVLSKSRSAPQHAAKRVVGPRKAVANFSKGFNQSSQRTEAAVTDGASEATVSDTVDIDEIFNSARKRPKSASAAQVR